MTALRQHRGLFVAVVASLVFVCVSRYLAFFWIRPYFLLQILTAFQYVFCDSICASVAIAAALLPQRRFTGLIWASAYGMSVVVANWLADIIRLPVPATPHLKYLAETLSDFVVTQGLRFLFGWRLANGPAAASHPSGQFRVLDLFEWTTSVGILLAFGQLWELSLSDAVNVLPIVVENVLVSLPVAWVATSERGLTWYRAGLTMLWALAVRIGEILLMHVTAGQPLRPWWMYFALIMIFVLPRLLTVGVFFGLLHRLGYRSHRPTRAPFAPAGA